MRLIWLFRSVWCFNYITNHSKRHLDTLKPVNSTFCNKYSIIAMVVTANINITSLIIRHHLQERSPVSPRSGSPVAPCCPTPVKRTDIREMVMQGIPADTHAQPSMLVSFIGLHPSRRNRHESRTGDVDVPCLAIYSTQAYNQYPSARRGVFSVNHRQVKISSFRPLSLRSAR